MDNASEEHNFDARKGSFNQPGVESVIRPTSHPAVENNIKINCDCSNPAAFKAKPWNFGKVQRE